MHSPVELLGVGVFAAICVVWPLYYYRGTLVSGIVFTPMLVCLIIFLLQVAPSMLLAHYYGFYPSVYPSIVFFLAYVFLWVGYLLPRNHRIVLSAGSGVAYFRILQSRGVLPERMARLAVIALLVLAGLNFYDGLPPTYHSLFATLTGNIGELAKELQQSRLALTKGAYFGGEYTGQGINTALQEIGWALLIAHAAAALAFRGGLRRVLWLVAMIVGAWLFVAGTGTRAPFVLSTVAGLIAYSLIRPVPIRVALAFFLFLIVMLVFLTSYTHRFLDIVTGEVAWSDAFTRVFERLIFGNGSNDVRAILADDQGMFNESVGHYHIRNFISAIPGVQGGLPLAYRLTEIYGGGATTFKSGTYLGTIYVDFGIAGIAVVFALIGTTLRLMQTAMLPVNPHPWSVAVVATITLISTKLITGGYQAVLSYGVVLVALLIVHFSVMVATRALPRHHRSAKRGNTGTK